MRILKLPYCPYDIKLIGNVKKSNHKFIEIS